jgi:hypothetical protein
MSHKKLMVVDSFEHSFGSERIPYFGLGFCLCSTCDRTFCRLSLCPPSRLLLRAIYSDCIHSRQNHPSSKQVLSSFQSETAALFVALGRV